MKKLTLGALLGLGLMSGIGPCRIRLDRRRRPADQPAGLRRHAGRGGGQAL